MAFPDTNTPRALFQEIFGILPFCADAQIRPTIIQGVVILVVYLSFVAAKRTKFQYLAMHINLPCETVERKASAGIAMIFKPVISR